FTPGRSPRRGPSPSGTTATPSACRSASRRSASPEPAPGPIPTTRPTMLDKIPAAAKWYLAHTAFFVALATAAVKGAERDYTGALGAAAAALAAVGVNLDPKLQ